MIGRVKDDADECDKLGQATGGVSHEKDVKMLERFQTLGI